MSQEVIKARNWVAVLYPENMIDDWQDRIYRILQVPFEYIIHDKDTVELEENENQPRKVHIHLIIHYGNTTTYKNAFKLFRSLSHPDRPQFPCLNKCEPVKNLQYMHLYLTHDTQDAKKELKFRYPVSSIVSGNNWDLGAFIELEDSDKLIMYQALRKIMITHRIVTVLDLEEYILVDYFDDILPDFTSSIILRYVKNNRKLFESIAREVNFKFFKSCTNGEKKQDKPQQE